jgi:hypothetical protein
MDTPRRPPNDFMRCASEIKQREGKAWYKRNNPHACSPSSDGKPNGCAINFERLALFRWGLTFEMEHGSSSPSFRDNPLLVDCVQFRGVFHPNLKVNRCLNIKIQRFPLGLDSTCDVSGEALG